MSDTVVGMGVCLYRWLFLCHLADAAFRSVTMRGRSLCRSSSIVLSASYTTADRRTTGRLGLVGTFDLVLIGDGTVRHPYPRLLSAKETVVEVNFTQHQEVVARVLHTQYPQVSTVSVSYLCALVPSLSCETICEMGEDVVVVSGGEVTRRTVKNDEVDQTCEMEYGLSLLQHSWDRIYRRWLGLCFYFDNLQVNISFTYDAVTNTSRCNASVSEPVCCVVTVYRRDEAVGSEPCVRDGPTVGGVLSYEPEDAEDLSALRCSVSGPLLKEVSVRLEPRDPSAALGVGLVFALLFATAVFVLAFRRRLGLRFLDRAVERVSSHLAYRRTETAG